MTGKSQTVIVSEIRDLLTRLIRRVNDLEGTISPTILDFTDEERKVIWNYGVINFRTDGFAQYQTFKALYEVFPDSIPHADLAEIVYDNDSANIYHCVRNLQTKLEESRCPLRVGWNKENVWLEDA